MEESKKTINDLKVGDSVYVVYYDNILHMAITGSRKIIKIRDMYEQPTPESGIEHEKCIYTYQCEDSKVKEHTSAVEPKWAIVDKSVNGEPLQFEKSSSFVSGILGMCIYPKEALELERIVEENWRLVP